MRCSDFLTLNPKPLGLRRLNSGGSAQGLGTCWTRGAGLAWRGWLIGLSVYNSNNNNNCNNNSSIKIVLIIMRIFQAPRHQMMMSGKRGRT